MNTAKRRTVIAGNWKMNFTPDQATAFINELKPMVAGKDNCDIIFCAPYVTIAAAQAAAHHSAAGNAAQPYGCIKFTQQGENTDQQTNAHSLPQGYDAGLFQNEFTGIHSITSGGQSWSLKLM